MVKLEIIDCTNRVPVALKNGVFVVMDTHFYEISISLKEPAKSVDIYLEDYLLQNVHYSEDKRKMTLSRQSLFIDSRGVVDLIIDDYKFQFDVCSKKLNFSEIEKMVLCLYNQDDTLLHSYLSRNKSQADKNIQADTSIPLSAKYIHKIDDIIRKYDRLIPEFIRTPYTVIRRHEVLCDYSEAVRDYDINWLLSNLDNIETDSRYIDHPNAIKINDEYGWINKILASENVVSFNNYENHVIIGGLHKIQKEIRAARKEIQLKLNSMSQRLMCYSQDSEYASFSDIKSIPLLRTEKSLCQIDLRVGEILLQYKKIFKGVKDDTAQAILLPPKCTPVFRSFKHYNAIFQDIMWLYKNKYNLNGEIDLVGLKNVSELYEVYCLLQIKDCFEDVFKEQFNRNKSELISIDKNLVI